MKNNKQKLKKQEVVGPIDKLDAWLLKRERFLFYFLCTLCLGFSLFLFNARISEGNDDSLYIEAGYNYATNFWHYSYVANAPLYPLFLGLLTKIFGIKLIIFKIFSIAFNFIGFVFLYKAFKGRISYTILFTVCFIVVTNHWFQYYASQTYTESIYLSIQFIFLYYFFKLLDLDTANEDLTQRKYLRHWLVIGLLLFVIIMTRNVAVAALPAIVLFFIMIKEYKYIFCTIGSFLLYRLPYEVIHKILWGGQKTQFSSQSNQLIQKDPYNAALGNDDFNGFVGRFFDNTQLYLSKRIPQLLGFREESSVETFGVISILIIGLMVLGFVKAYRSKNKALFFSVLYTTSLVSLTFIILQARWDQPRLIMIHIPIILFTVFFGLAQLFKKSAIAQNFLIVFFVVLMCSGFMASAWRMGNNLPIVVKNLKGDKYYGYTADWVNFFKISEWCSTHLPDSALVASRKAPMSFVYGNGKRFFPIYKVAFLDTTTQTSNPDSVLAYFKKNKVTHVILASLRKDPSKADGDIINTLHRMIQPISVKYPNKLKLICQFPPPEQAQIEPSYLYEINY